MLVEDGDDPWNKGQLKHIMDYLIIEQINRLKSNKLAKFIIYYSAQSVFIIKLMRK